MRFDLLHGGGFNSHLVGVLVEAVRQVMHGACGQGAAGAPGLVDGVLRPLGSDADAIAGGGGGREGERKRGGN